MQDIRELKRLLRRAEGNMATDEVRRLKAILRRARGSTVTLDEAYGRMAG